MLLNRLHVDYCAFMQRATNRKRLSQFKLATPLVSKCNNRCQIMLKLATLIFRDCRFLFEMHTTVYSAMDV